MFRFLAVVHFRCRGYGRGAAAKLVLLGGSSSPSDNIVDIEFGWTTLLILSLIGSYPKGNSEEPQSHSCLREQYRAGILRPHFISFRSQCFVVVFRFGRARGARSKFPAAEFNSDNIFLILITKLNFLTTHEARNRNSLSNKSSSFICFFKLLQISNRLRQMVHDAAIWNGCKGFSFIFLKIWNQTTSDVSCLQPFRRQEKTSKTLQPLPNG